MTNIRIYLMLLPSLSFIGMIFGGGLLFGLYQSLGLAPIIGESQLTFKHYLAVLSDETFLKSLWLTFRIAASVSVLSIILAIAIAFTLRQRFSGSHITTFIFQLPLPVPHLVAAGATVILFAQSGLFARVAYHFNLIDSPRDFPALLYDPYSFGISISFLWKEIPFIGLIVLAILKSIGPHYEEIAKTLGANSWQRFRHILLPLILPGILSASIIIFAFTFANFEIPLLLGQTHPTTLPVKAWQEFSDPDLSRRPIAMAMTIILALVCIMLLIAYKNLAQYAAKSGN